MGLSCPLIGQSFTYCLYFWENFKYFRLYLCPSAVKSEQIREQSPLTPFGGLPFLPKSSIIALKVALN
jgi:hypothetical protein